MDGQEDAGHKPNRKRWWLFGTAIVVLGLIVVLVIRIASASDEHGGCGGGRISSIGVLRQQLEMWCMEHPNAALPADIKAFEAAGGPPATTFITPDVADMQLDPAARIDPASGRYIGYIRQIGANGAPTIVVSFEANGAVHLEREESTAQKPQTP